MPALSTEMTGLIALAVLILVHVSVQAMLLKSSAGNAWTVSARDTTPEVSELAQRAKRATANLLETALVFVIIALVTEVTGRGNSITAASAIVYLIGRSAYLPAYLIGYPWVRTIIWNISTAALAVMIAGVLITTPMTS